MITPSICVFICILSYPASAKKTFMIPKRFIGKIKDQNL